MQERKRARIKQLKEDCSCALFTAPEHKESILLGRRSDNGTDFHHKLFPLLVQVLDRLLRNFSSDNSSQPLKSISTINTNFPASNCSVDSAEAVNSLLFLLRQPIQKILELESTAQKYYKRTTTEDPPYAYFYATVSLLDQRLSTINLAALASMTDARAMSAAQFNQLQQLLPELNSIVNKVETDMYARCMDSVPVPHAFRDATTQYNLQRGIVKTVPDIDQDGFEIMETSTQKESDIRTGVRSDSLSENDLESDYSYTPISHKSN